MTPLHRAARAYAERLDWSVLPLEYKSKVPARRLFAHGHKQATRDPIAIDSAWGLEPEANIGIACAASGFFALDVDPRNGGDESLAELVKEHGPLPTTVRARTGGGGSHYLFTLHEEKLRGKVAPGVDIKADGYIVAAPSIVGAAYRWEEYGHPLSTAIADAPAWLLELARVPEPTPAPAIPCAVAPELEARVDRAIRLLRICEPAISGSNGHDRTFAVCAKITRGLMIPTHLSFALISEYWNDRCQPPWSDSELRRKVQQSALHSKMPFGFLVDKPRRSTP